MSFHPLVKKAALLAASVTVAVTGSAGIAGASTSAPYLQYGSRGEGVKCVQIAVNWANAFQVELAEDGIWGKQTQYAVVAFQRWKLGDSQADGIVGPNTGDKLMETLREYNVATANYCYRYLPTH
ncbi:peptidoglycan-binding protein [Streptomyces sp. NPDC093094]|uniref:peptidoglycan-binding domain-containing protein n=1 Tax=Streptomyces sp. NPDC093094 TaxID=3366026 RepID=UPI003814705D